MTNNPDDIITVRLILPSGVKAIRGKRDFVVEEVNRLMFLESDLGESYAEIIPFAAAQQTETLPLGENTNDNTNTSIA